MTTSSIEFSFEFRGEKYQCFYSVEGKEPGTIRVSTPWGPRTGPLGKEPPLVVARLLAAGQARDAKLH